MSTHAPADPAVHTWDDLVVQLAALRLERGAPSYGELARRIDLLRAQRGERHARPGRTTVYDLFRRGRRRLDVVLLLDTVAALGTGPQELAAWRSACRQVEQASGRDDRVPAALGV